MTKRAFGELELTILQLFRSGDRKTVKEVQATLGGQDKYTTIMTVMNRLVEKRVLVRERVGLQYEYWVSLPQAKIPSLFDQFKQKFFGVKPAALVSYLIESSQDITDQDLEDMERMIEKARKERKGP